MEPQVVSLLATRPLLTVREAAAQLGTSVEDMGSVFAAIAEAHDGAYTLLSSVIEKAASRQSTSVAMRKAESIAGDASAYALLAAAYPAHALVSSLPVQLCPATASLVRAYPVVSRTTMEGRRVSTMPTPATIAPVKLESSTLAKEVKMPAAVPAPPVSAAEPAAALPPPPPPRPPTPSPASPTIGAAPPPPPSASSVKREDEAPAPAPLEPAPPAPAPVTASSTTPGAAPKPTIFDKMKEAAASKRVRDEGSAATAPSTAGSSAKIARAPARPRKAAKTEPTTSIAKLARASKKKTDNKAAATPAASASPSFLDDDEGDSTNHFSRSEDRSSYTEPAVQEETPIFDVVEVSASNDDVIMCDDAPPLAFRPAAPVQASPTAKKETVAKKGGAGSVGEAGAAQSTLSSFFQTAVVEFQKAYVREVHTEMQVEDGEFVCCDVPCYKHKTTGEVISEVEYHQQTAALARSRRNEAGDDTPSGKGAGTAPVSPPSPAAAQKLSTRSAAGKSDGREKATAVPTKTLLSFFKPTTAS